MGARPKLTQKRRTQMLEAAMEVIADRGLCETRIADVAERAGLSPALVVYYFGSKETLLTEALAYAEDLFYIEAFRELTGIEGAKERLVRLIELACPPVVRREADEYWTLWVELWSRALRNEEAARKREALERRWRYTIAEVVREGERSGEFGPCDPERFATYLSALMDGLALQVLFDDRPPIESGLEPENGTLRVYNWADYINPAVLKSFTKEFGNEVEVTTFYNSQEATQKLRTGKVSFDVFFPTQDDLPKYVAGKLLQPLNHDYLPNLEKNVWPTLADPFYDRGSRYTTPYVTYSTGIGWRTDMVPADVAGMDNPREIFLDPEYKGITGLYDEYRDALSVGMYRSGLTGVNEANASDLNKATDNLLELPD